MFDELYVAGSSATGAKPFGTGNIFGQLNIVLNGVAEFIGGTFRGPRFDVIEPGPISGLQLLFSNQGPNNAGGPAAITLGCSIELLGDQSGTKYPITFGGRLLTTLDPNGFIWSDPINVDVPKGGAIWPRTYVTVPATQLGLAYTFVGSSGYFEGGDWAGSNPVDNRNSGTITLQNNRTLWGPVAARGFSPGLHLPVLGLFGDSIITGTGDSFVSNIANPFWRGGWAMRGINGRVPVLQSTRGGETTSLGSIRPYVRGHFTMCDHVISATGVNDLTGGNTLATLQTNLVILWRSLGAMGPQVWQPTLTPRSTSTDSWATLANQTTDSGNPKRILLNAWLRDGSPLDPVTLTALGVGSIAAIRAGNALHPLAGYLEVADYVESARDSGLWQVNYTADGIHPTMNAHIAASAALADLSRFGYTGA